MPDHVRPSEPPKDNAAGATPPAGAPQGAPAPAAPTAPAAPAAGGGAWPPAGEISKDDKTMAMVAWLLGIISYFAGPLVIYLIKKDQSKFVAFHALQAMWFGVVAFVAVMVLTGVTCGIGIILWLAPLVIDIVWGLKANKGEWAELPVVGDWARKGL